MTVTVVQDSMMDPEHRPGQEYSVDVVMPYCNEPLDGLLSKKTGYDEDWLPSPVPFRHAKLILYRLYDCFDQREVLSDRKALASLPEAAAAAQLFGHVEVVPVNASPSAWEAARYFLYLGYLRGGSV
eukprot:g24623.t1